MFCEANIPSTILMKIKFSLQGSQQSLPVLFLRWIKGVQVYKFTPNYELKWEAYCTWMIVGHNGMLYNIIVFLLFCTFRSVLLCCSVYCLCVNAYWTNATGISGYFSTTPTEVFLCFFCQL
jgi:hypothetical protein